MSTEAIVSTAAVLSFHKIGAPGRGGWDTWNYIPEASFVAQLEALHASGYRYVDIDTFLRGLAGETTLPERSALLTFDDGYRSMLSVAQPILERFDAPAVVFVPTQFVGGVNEWDRGTEPEEPLCDWDELAELQRRGTSVQAHSVTHTAFSTLTVDAQRGEIERSKATIEAQLGTTVACFAYPYGDAGEHTRATESLFEQTDYRAAFLYKGGACALPTSTPFQITRIPMGPDTTLANWLGGAS